TPTTAVQPSSRWAKQSSAQAICSRPVWEVGFPTRCGKSVGTVDPVTIRAKICGIRTEADLRIAVAAGADAVGFISGVTHFSEDALLPDRAAELSARTPPFVTRVLVTHLEDASSIIELAEHIGVDAIQVHG